MVLAPLLSLLLCAARLCTAQSATPFPSDSASSSPLPSASPSEALLAYNQLCLVPAQYDTGCDAYMSTLSPNSQEFLRLNCSTDPDGAIMTQDLGWCCCKANDGEGSSRCGQVDPAKAQELDGSNVCATFNSNVAGTPSQSPFPSDSPTTQVPAEICANPEDVNTLQTDQCRAAYEAAFSDPQSPFYDNGANTLTPLNFDCGTNDAADEYLDQVALVCCGNQLSRCGPEYWALNCENPTDYIGTSDCNQWWFFFDVDVGDSVSTECSSLGPTYMDRFKSIAHCCCQATLSDGGIAYGPSRCGFLDGDALKALDAFGGCPILAPDNPNNPYNWANICLLPDDFIATGTCDVNEYFGLGSGNCTDFFSAELCGLDPLVFDCQAYPEAAQDLEMYARTQCCTGGSRCSPYLGVTASPSPAPVNPSESSSPAPFDGCNGNANGPTGTECPWHSTCYDLSPGFGCACEDANYPQTTFTDIFNGKSRDDCCALPSEPCATDGSEFTCSNGRCIKAEYRCSSTNECGDDSDEQGCLSAITGSCPLSTFECFNGDCVSTMLVCSGTPDCADASDEQNCESKPCPTGTFSCAAEPASTGLACVPLSAVCDFKFDCADASDEDYSLCFPSIADGCPDFLFDCSFGPTDSTTFGQLTGLSLPNGLTRCIPELSVCDGTDACRVTTADEESCPETCRPSCFEQVCGAPDCCGGRCSGSSLDHTCGPDSWGLPQRCDEEGECVCKPSCAADAVCGDDDGCGRPCRGSCDATSDQCVMDGYFAFCAPVFTQMSSDVPKVIGAGANQNVVSTLVITEPGVIRDVNVISLAGQHEVYGEIRMTLLSPAGTVVEIVSRLCNYGRSNFILNLDDEAEAPQACPPDNQGAFYLPSNSMDVFNHESMKGTWKLTIVDNFAGNGGQLTSWGLEIAVCAPACPPTSVCGDSDGCGTGCVTDNGCGADQMCAVEGPLTKCVCKPDCAGKNCGDDDGCGGLCVVQSGCASGSTCGVAGSPNPGQCGDPYFVSTEQVLLDSSQDSLHVSKIMVDGSPFNLLQVEVVNVRGTHTNVGDLTMMLRSPAGTLVEFMSPRCAGYSNFALSFSDGATSSAYPCPPTNGMQYRPSNPFLAFYGEPHSGEWELLIYDNNDADGGRLDGWGLRFQLCTGDCTGKNCGDDNGCGFPCVQQSCPASETCQAGVCQCKPDCSAATFCGDSDGCGGYCTVQTCGDVISTPASLPLQYQQECRDGTCQHPQFVAYDSVLRAGAALPATGSNVQVQTTLATAVVGSRPNPLDSGDISVYPGGVILSHVDGLFVDGIYNLRLTSPAGTSAWITNDPSQGQGSALANSTCRVGFSGIVFSEDGLAPLSCPPSNSETYNTKESLSVFDGELATGQWSLEILGQPGELRSWALTVAACASTCVEGIQACGDDDGCGNMCIYDNCPSGFLSATPSPSATPAPPSPTPSESPFPFRNDKYLCQNPDDFAGAKGVNISDAWHPCNEAVAYWETLAELEINYTGSIEDYPCTFTDFDFESPDYIVFKVLQLTGYCCCNGRDEDDRNAVAGGVSKCGPPTALDLEMLAQMNITCEDIVPPYPSDTPTPSGTPISSTPSPSPSHSESLLPLPDDGEAVGTDCEALDYECILCDNQVTYCKACSGGKVVSSDGGACLDECSSGEIESFGVCQVNFNPPAQSKNTWMYWALPIAAILLVFLLFMFCRNRKRKKEDSMINTREGEVIEGNANTDVAMDTMDVRPSFENDTATTGYILKGDDLDDEDDDEDYMAHETQPEGVPPPPPAKRASVNLHVRPSVGSLPPA